MSAAPAAEAPASGTPALVLEATPEQVAVSAALESVRRIAELDQPLTTLYEECSPESSLHPLVEAHDVIIVAGGHFGDEGKGKMTDAIASIPAVSHIVRVNSGENAGHTIYHAGKKFVWHLCPSGVLIKGRVNMVGPECVMDPVTFFDEEVGQLIAAGVDYSESLFVGDVHIVTPYHKLLDWLLSPHNSSTLRGMAPIHSSKVLKRGIRMDHLFNSVTVCAERLRRDMAVFDAHIAASGLTLDQLHEKAVATNADGVVRLHPHVIDFIRAPDRVEYLLQLYRKYVIDNPRFPRRRDVAFEIRRALATGHKVLVEGPQSYWLSNKAEKFWESSTSADTSASGLVATSTFNFQRYRTLVINVHKTPGTSRVGIGANPAAFVPQSFFSSRGIATLRDLPAASCRDFAAVQRSYWASVRPNGTLDHSATYEDAGGRYYVGAAMAMASSLEHGECGSTTKKPRVTGMFDCVAYAEVNEVQGPYLAVSAVDRGDVYDHVGVVVAYVYHAVDGIVMHSNGVEFANGKIIRAGDPLPTEPVLAKCHPIIRLIPGWRDTPVGAGKRAPGSALPAGVCQLLDCIERFCGAHILCFGNGPDSHDVVYVKRAGGSPPPTAPTATLGELLRGSCGAVH